MRHILPGCRHIGGAFLDMLVGRRIGVAAVALTFPAYLPAQTAAEPSASVRAAAATIAATALQVDGAALTDDSMGGRVMPSPGLERAAQYVAAQFRRIGLAPDLIRYALPGQLRLDAAASAFRFTMFLREDGREVLTDEGLPLERGATVPLDAAALVLSDRLPEKGGGTRLGNFGVILRGRAVLVAGPLTADALTRAPLAGAVALYVPPRGLDWGARQVVVAQLAARSRGVVVLDPAEDSAAFAARWRAARPPQIIDDYIRTDDSAATAGWAVQVRPSVLRDLLARLGVDPTRVQAEAAAAPQMRELPPLGVWLDLRVDRPPPAAKWEHPANVAALLEGCDSLLKRQIFVIAAHLDGRDSLRRGADDNASGVAGLLALARAFSRPDARPRRSVLFVATSGDATATWGSQAFATRLWREHVGALTLDMLGRPAGDSLLIDGIQDVELAANPLWVSASHPELGVTVADGGSVIGAGGAAEVFARKSVPTLAVHVGRHPADGAPAARDDADVIDWERVARRLRLVFYLTAELAAAPARPHWSAAGRQARSQP